MAAAAAAAADTAETPLAEAVQLNGRSLHLLLFRDVTNPSELRAALTSGSSMRDMALINPGMAAGAFHVKLAALKALEAEAQGRMTARTLHAELVHLMACTKHVGEAFKRCGIHDDSRHVLVAMFDATPQDIEDVRRLTQGTAAPLSQLAELQQTEAIQQAFKVTKDELHVGSLEDDVVAKMAGMTCHRLPLPTSPAHRRIMSSVVAPPAPGSQSAAADSSSTTTKAYSPDAPQPAYAGAAAAPAGPAGSDVEAEAAPLRFKGTQPVRRSRTAVPGLATTCWGTDQLKQQYPQLNEDTDADVAVVGGGISGLTTAYLLAKAGKRVVVLESRLLGSGQTGRSVGDMTSWHTGLFSSLERYTSTEQRRQVALSNTEAIDFVENVVSTEGISCGFTRCPAYVLPSAADAVPGDSSDPRSSSSSSGSSDKQAERLIMQELEACKAAGLDAKWADVGTAGAGGSRAIELPQSACLNPMQYIQGLAQVITEKYGGRIFEQTRLRKADSGRKKLTTMEGHTVRAKQYVLATASPVTSSIVDSALHVLALHGKQHVRRRYVIALKVPKFSGYKPGLFYDTAEPQHTALLTPGRQTGRDGYHDLLVVAGEAHDQGMRANEYPSDPAGALEAWARTRWPGAGQRLYQWSYQYYQTAEDLGLYGQDPTATASKGVYVATGDCGRIMSGGTIGGNVIASQMLGWPAGQLYKNMYNPSRKLRGGIPGLPAWSPRYFKTTINSALNMLLPLPTYLKAGRDIESLPRGEGTIINSGPLALRKVAVYKDPSGEVQKFSGLCPHLGCLLQWNPEDKEFNCPCHGSCFSAEGKNLAGPATIDMSRID